MNQQPFCAPWLLCLARAFQAAGKPLYGVGGIVRNALMGLPASDTDLCGPARPEEVVQLCEGTDIHAVLRAAHFGTVELHLADAEGRHMAEYTTFRVDSYRCGHQPIAVRFADTPQVDALRRDFSVNALYRQLVPTPDATIPILDPTGGLQHLRQGVLHTVTADPDIVLKDDGLRILRAARFQAELGLQPTDALLVSATKYASLLNDIAMERIRDELTKLLLSDARYPTLVRTMPPVPAGLHTLCLTDAWSPVFGTLAPNETAIAATAHYRAPEGIPPISGKLALLLMDAQPDALTARMEALHFSAKDTQVAATALLATWQMRTGHCTRMEAVRLGLPSITHATEAFAALVQAGARYADALDKAQTLCGLLQIPSLPKSLKELAIHGNDLLPLCRELHAPTQRIGRILDALWQAVVDDQLPNERKALLTTASQWLSS